MISTGETRSVREFVELAFAEIGRGIEWRGKGVEETGVDRKTGKTVIRIDPTYFRPTEVDELIGDASKARQKLGWKPKTRFANSSRKWWRAILQLPGGRLPMARTPFELKGKTVFVAGHGGMVGAALVRRLAQENVELLTVKRATSICAIRLRCSAGSRKRARRPYFSRRRRSAASSPTTRCRRVQARPLLARRSRNGLGIFAFRAGCRRSDWAE
jgi:nucleoside-diphosphate-sugar epimerase